MFRLKWCFVIWRVKKQQISNQKRRQKGTKSHAKKKACCEEAPEGILDGKLADNDPRHHGTGLLEGGGDG